MTPVTIFVQSDILAPVEGVVVEIYQTNGTFVSSGTTGSDGISGYTLSDGSYDIRFYQLGTSILPNQPQRIIVDHTLSSNYFTVSAHVNVRPDSTDPLKCRITGYMRRSDDQPIKQRLIFAPEKDLIMINGLVVPPGTRVELSADDTGYVDFELFRGVTYRGYFLYVETLLSMIPPSMLCLVPNLPSVNLNDLLFPVPVSTTFSSLSITLSVSSVWDDSILVSTLWSDGSINHHLPAWSNTVILAADPTIVEVCKIEGYISIRGLKTGSTTITMTRSISECVYFVGIPDFTSQTITVTIS